MGTLSNLSIYTLVLENDLPTWSLKWTLPLVSRLCCRLQTLRILSKMKPCRSISCAILTVIDVHCEHIHGTRRPSMLACTR